MPDESETLVREPQDTGTAGTQQPASPTENLNQLGAALQGLPMVQAVVGLATTRSKGLGGEITAGLLAGIVHQTAQEYHDTKRELATTRERLEQKQQALADSRQEVAVLLVRLREVSSGRHLRNLLIIVGSFLIGLGFDSYRNGLNTGAIIFCGLGALLVLVGWFAQRGKAEK